MTTMGLDTDMLEITRKSCDPDFDDAWRLFTAMHDNPSSATARDLIKWLEQCPQHVRAFDDVLTLWALAGGGLVKRANPAVLNAPLVVQ